MLAIVGLVPIGTKASRDAIGDGYAADYADYLLHYLASRVSDDITWQNWIEGSGIPADPADISDPQLEIDDPDDPSDPYSTFRPISCWTPAPGIDYLYFSNAYADGGDVVYRIYRERQNAAGTGIAEFDAIVRIWKSPTTAWEYVPSSGLFAPSTDNLYESRAQLNIELSWPASIPFADRHRAYYTMEVTR